MSHALRVLCFAICFLALVRAQQAGSTDETLRTFDGAWWQSLSTLEKVNAVQGMSVGYDAGYNGARDAIQFSVMIALGWHCTDSCAEFERSKKLTKAADQLALKRVLGSISSQAGYNFLNAILSTANGQRPDFTGRTFGKMMEQLDRAYERLQDPGHTPLPLLVECAETNGRDCAGVVNGINARR